MDTLIARVVPRASVPAPASLRPVQGRLGQLFAMLQQAEPDQALEVECRDMVHVGTTARAMRDKAHAARITIGSLRTQNTLYLWREA